MTLDRDFVDVWAYPICCTAGMANDTLSRDAFQEEQNTTYHFAAWHKMVQDGTRWHKVAVGARLIFRNRQ